MRKIIALFLCLLAAPAFGQTGTPQTKTQLNTETSTNFPDNTSGLITPLITRQSMVDYIASWQQVMRLNSQNGTTYTYVADDYGKLVTFSNAAATAVTLPQASTTGFINWNVISCNRGGGTVTITPTVSTINGRATLVLATDTCVTILSDGGNYQIDTLNFGTHVNAQTGTTYTFTNADFNWVVTFSNGSPVAVMLPQATTNFAHFSTTACNVNTGAVTITPTTSTIGGASTLVLQNNQCAQIVSDGTNYQLAGRTIPPALCTNGYLNNLSNALIATCVSIQQGLNFNNCSLAASVGSNLLTVALKDNAGNDPSATSPCTIFFRNATASTGSTTADTVTAALSISTFATGATLGSVNAQAFRFWVVAFDNGGTVVLALYNAWNDTTTALNQPATCSPIDEGNVHSSTAISGSATSSGVYYTPNGTALTSKAVRILGYVEYNSSGLATAGTYASGPNFIQVFGPGVEKPCAVLAIATATQTTGSSTTSGTAATATSLSITPTSAASRIKLETVGSLSSSSGRGGVSIYRGSAACTTQVVGSQDVSGTLETPAYTMGYDHANTNASTSYTVCIHSGAAGTTIWGNTGGLPGAFGSLVVSEIMG